MRRPQTAGAADGARPMAGSTGPEHTAQRTAQHLGPDRPQPRPSRTNPRMKGFDYASEGMYFITIVTKNRAQILGKITCAARKSADDAPFVGAGYIRPGESPPANPAAGKRQNICPENVRNELTWIGGIAERCLLDIPNHYPEISIDKYVIMPDHIHAILVIGGNETAPAGRIYPAPTDKNSRADRPKAGKLSDVVGKFKAGVSRCVGRPVWQRSFHDHVIRNEQDYEEIWRYISGNPLQWLLDGKTPGP